MEIHAPKTLESWYGKEMVICRGPDRTLVLMPPGEFEAMVAATYTEAPKSALSASQYADLMTKTLKPTGTRITPAGLLTIPDDLLGWVEPSAGKYWAFRGAKHGVEISLGYPPCLCDDPDCRKCLQVRCRDPKCPVHLPNRKTKFRMTLQSTKK